MESAELEQYDDQTETGDLDGITAEKMMEGATDVSYNIDFEKQELLDGEEVVMEGLPPLSDGSEALQVIQCEDDESANMLEVDPRHQKVDKDDPRSRLHYIKYLKKEGKPMKMWECGICGKEFRHQYTLMRHLPTHTDERNYKCEDCGKAFRQMSTLSQHRAIHSDARPYVCECCNKTFNRVSTLISHRKTHSDMKPHKCPICFKGFHQKGNLRNHVFTHTNERPYKCEICEKGFNQMSNLVCHKAHVHGDKSRHVCNMCGSEFLRRYALRLHQEYTHGIVYRGSNRVQVKKTTDEPSGARKEEGLATKRSLRTVNSTVSLKARNNSSNNTSQNLEVETKVTTSSEVIIDPIETKAMKTAKDSGQTTFALFKPAKGIPVLVKVMPAPNNKQMLVPATVEDLKSAGKITVSPNYESGNNGSPIKAVQIKVPVVATVIQRVGENGQLTISVESPGPEQAPEISPAERRVSDEPIEEPTMDSDGEADGDVEEVTKEEALDVDEEVEEEVEEEMDEDEVSGEGDAMTEENLIQYIDEDGNVVTMNADGSEVQYLQDDGSLVTGQSTVVMHPDGTDNDDDQTAEEYTAGDQAHEIMQMETDDGIQLVRATGDGTYEIISEEEAALLLQNQEQAIEIFEDGSDSQFQHMLEEGDDGEILVNQNNLSALVSAIRSAGYEVMPGEGEEDLVNLKPDLLAVKSEPVQMEIEDGTDFL